MKVGTLTELRVLQVVLSSEQKSDFDVPSLTLSLMMLASTVIGLAMSFIMLVVQLSRERARMAQEALTSKARRLRSKADNMEVKAPDLADGLSFHTFLSHVWGTGQDQMRVVKQRLREMVPSFCVFLDVDDLEEIGDLEGYITSTLTMLVYCSSGYFESKNCMRELVAAAIQQKPIVTLVDTDISRGGISASEVRRQLIEAEDSFGKWGFDDTTPRGAVLHDDHLLRYEPIEWNRIGVFQEITMRLIAERLLPSGIGTTYVARELVNQKLKPLPLPRDSHKYHVYCSELNLGAAALISELAVRRSFVFLPELGPHDRMPISPSSRNRLRRRTVVNESQLFMTTNPEDLATCDNMLLYLNSQTWTLGGASASLADEIRRALDLGVRVLLAHEMLGRGQEARFGCDFGSFFSCADGATPGDLLKRGIYSQIAVPLKGDAWREASMPLLGMALGMSKEQVESAVEGVDVLGLGSTAMEIPTQVVSSGARVLSALAMLVHSVAERTLRKSSISSQSSIARRNVRDVHLSSAHAHDGQNAKSHDGQKEQGHDGIEMNMQTSTRQDGVDVQTAVDAI